MPAESKVLAWGVLCGSGERAGKLHKSPAGLPSVGTEISEGHMRSYAEDVLRDYYEQICGPHSVVPLGVVERAESKGGE